MGLLDRWIGPGDRDAFGEEVRRRLARLFPGKNVVYDPEEFCVEVEDGPVGNLGNVWGEIEGRSRLQRRAAAANFVSMFSPANRAEVPGTWEEASPLVLPKLRSRMYLECMSLSARAEGRTPIDVPHHVLGEHYTVEIACDFPRSATTVNAETLAKWGRSFDEALITATRNLRQRPPTAVGSFASPSGAALYVVMSGDTYDATRLLTLDVVWRRVGRSMDAVAIPVHRGALMLADPTSTESLQALAALAMRDFDEPYGNGAVPLRFAFGEWSPWLPEPGHPAHESLARLVRRSLAWAYDEQRKLWEKIHEREGTDVFLPDAAVTSSDDWRTMAVWPEHIAAWLPQVDVVCLGRERANGSHGDEIYVPWAAFVEIAGASMEPLDMYPKRWQVKDFPDDAAMARLAAAAVRKP